MFWYLLVDLMLTRRTTECRNSAQCHGAKHHFDECVERVQQQESEDGAKEDCVEECTCYFHILYASALSRHERSSAFSNGYGCWDV